MWFSALPARPAHTEVRKNYNYERAIIGELRNLSDVFRFLNKQAIVNYGVEHYNKLLVGREVNKVCQILKESFSESYGLDELLDMAIYDYLK